MGSFVMKRVREGYLFHLYATNRLILATSQIYNTADACKKGILSVTDCVGKAGEVDLTVPGHMTPENPRFEITRDGVGKFFFRLRATKGEIILTSSGYATPQLASLGIGMVRRSVENAGTYEVKGGGRVVLMNILKRQNKEEGGNKRTGDVAEIAIYTDRPLILDSEKETDGIFSRPDA